MLKHLNYYRTQVGISSKGKHFTVGSTKWKTRNRWENTKINYNSHINWYSQDPQYVAWKDFLGWLDHQLLSTHSSLLVLILMLAVGCRGLCSIDLGGAYTCQDDIIKLMNIAFLQNCSKYSPLFKKVKKSCLEILFFLIYANFQTPIP